MTRNIMSTGLPTILNIVADDTPIGSQQSNQCITNQLQIA
jgi:hypothetical protein